MHIQYEFTWWISIRHLGFLSLFFVVVLLTRKFQMIYLKVFWKLSFVLPIFVWSSLLNFLVQLLYSSASYNLFCCPFVWFPSFCLYSHFVHVPFSSFCLVYVWVHLQLTEFSEYNYFKFFIIYFMDLYFFCFGYR